MLARSAISWEVSRIPHVLQPVSDRLDEILLHIYESEPGSLELYVLGLDGLALFDDRFDPGFELAGDEDTGHVTPVRLVDIFPHGFDRVDFPLEGFSGSQDFFCEFQFLRTHVLSDIIFGVPECFFDALEDPFLDVIVFLGDNCEHLAVEHFDFVVEVIDFCFNFGGQSFQSLCGFDSGRFETVGVGDQVGIDTVVYQRCALGWGVLVAALESALVVASLNVQPALKVASLDVQPALQVAPLDLRSTALVVGSALVGRNIALKVGYSLETRYSSSVVIGSSGLIGSSGVAALEVQIVVEVSGVALGGGVRFEVVLDVDGVGVVLVLVLVVGVGIGHVLILDRGGTATAGFAISGATGHSPLGGLVEQRLVLEEGQQVVVVGVGHLILRILLILSTRISMVIFYLRHRVKPLKQHSPQTLSKISQQRYIFPISNQISPYWVQESDLAAIDESY